MLQVVEALISQVVEISEKAKKSIKGKRPEYSPIYLKAVDMAEELSVHANGDKPSKLFEQNAPNETDEQRKFRESQHQPTTLQTWHKAESTINRIYNDSNYTVDEWADDEHKEYFLEQYPTHGSILSFYNSVRTHSKLYDSNAVQAIKPRQLPEKLVDGQKIIDDTALIEPIAVIYKSHQVIYFEEEHYCLVELEEKSWVEFGNTKVKEGRIFEYYDRTDIWRITQVGRKVDNEFQYEVYYNHNLGYLPVEKLGGVPVRVENDLLYKSYFYPALADLNDALYDESTLRIGKVGHIFPRPWEIAEKCVADGCVDGYIFDGTDDNGEKIYSACPTCKGTSQRPHPTNVLQVYMPTRLGPDDGSVPPTPPAGFIQVDIKGVEFLRKEIDKKLEQAFAGLNIDVANKPNGQTATESKIDREELFSFLLKFAQEEFGSLKWSIDTMGKMRYDREGGGKFEPPVIREPREFSVRSYDELTTELKEAREAKIPMIAFKKLLDEYHIARFNGDKRMTEITDVVFYADRLIMLTDEEATKKVQLSLAEKWEGILHDSIYSFIEQALVEDEKFFDKDIKDQAEILKNKAKEIATGLQPTEFDINSLINANPQEAN